MKKTILYFFISISITTSGQDTDDYQLVKNAFSNYKKSILESTGSEAIKWVDTKTLSYYDKMLEASLYSDSSEVQKLGLMDKLTLFTVRHRVTSEEIKKMNGNDFFIYAIDKGMVGKNSVMTVEIGEVKITGNFANAQIVSNGQKSPLYFQFNKEAGQWKIDLTSIFPASNTALKKMISDNGMTESEFIFKTLEMLTGKPVDKEIWRPMK